MKNTWSKEYPEFTPNVSPTEMFLAGTVFLLSGNQC